MIETFRKWVWEDEDRKRRLQAAYDPAIIKISHYVYNAFTSVESGEHFPYNSCLFGLDLEGMCRLVYKEAIRSRSSIVLEF